MNTKGWIALIVVAIIAIIGCFTPVGKTLFGTVGTWTNYYGISSAQSRTGPGCDDGFSTCNGTTISAILTGTCNATFSGSSLAATSSGQFYCSASGVAAGDKVFVMLPVGAGANSQGASSLYGGFNAHTGYATTTNVIGFNIENFTGTATSSFAQATTSIQYYVIR